MVHCVYVCEQDWWNSSTFANYYRTWNVVVHDWLYCYVYKECYLVCLLSFTHTPTVITLCRHHRLGAVCYISHSAKHSKMADFDPSDPELLNRF